MEERWDIYDKNKQLTGRTMKRNDWTLKDDEYHLTVLGVIRRSDGKFLITKRVMTKAWAPGWWEVSGGAAQAGEASYDAVLREVKEETGLDVKDAEGGYMFTYKRENPGEGDNYSDFSCVLSNFFFVDTFNDNNVLSVHLCFDSFWISHNYRMRETKVESDFFSFFLCSVTNTVDFKLLFVSFRYTCDHVCDQRSCKTM